MESNLKTRPLRQIVILGAGRPYRGETPSAVTYTPDHRRVLDWLLDAFKPLGSTQIAFVGGYKIDRVLADYPYVRCIVNSDWERTGAAGSLLSALSAPGVEETELWGCYADVVFRPQAVEALAATAGSAVLFDPDWRERYAARSEKDILAAEKVRVRSDRLTACSAAIRPDEASGELAGLWKLDASTVHHLTDEHRRAPDTLARLTIPQILEKLIEAGHTIGVVPATGGWAELNAPQDLARFVLGTKAETLERLRPMVRHSAIGPGMSFNVGEWRSDPEAVLNRIGGTFSKDTAVVVRSSTRAEDRWNASHAGRFRSVLDVPCGDRRAIRQAVESVIESYGAADGLHDVLVQPMVGDAVISGVLLTRTLLRGGPYRVVNYNDRSGDTTLVTGGAAAGLRTVVVARDMADRVGRLDDRLRPVIRAAMEIEELVGYDSLDIEFAVDSGDRVRIFQVRPMVADQNFRNASDESARNTRDAARRLFNSLQEARPGVVGGRNVFGVMPDWNPAEIIGTKPRPLAFGIYRHLVTDEVWADQRAEAGYRDIRPHALLASFGGMPYVDVRASLNSFVPADLDDVLAGRLVDYGMTRLIDRPELHDKVEFEVAFTSFDFDLNRRLREELLPAGWNSHEVGVLEVALGALTRKHLGRVEEFCRKTEEFGRRFAEWMAGHHAYWDRAWGLLGDCRKFGTPVFAHLARAAFMSVAILRSLVRKGLLSEVDHQMFFQSLRTVTRELETDGRRVGSGEMNRSELIAEYGHLRPGTYDITSSRYDSDPAAFLDPLITVTATRPTARGGDSVLVRQRLAAAIDREMTSCSWGWKISGSELVRLMCLAIEGREKSKFVFTRFLSRALEDFKLYGSELGMSSDDLSYVSLEDLRSSKVAAHAAGAGGWLRQRMEEGRRDYAVTAALELPALLLCEEDFGAFERPDSRPNFVTQARVVAAASLVQGAVRREQLVGRIALVPAADPGFDWLFGYGITGLITMYGGANSHMAIRAAEQNLPAAVGVGEKLFDLLTAGRLIDLDCASEKIHIVP